MKTYYKREELLLETIRPTGPSKTVAAADLEVFPLKPLQLRNQAIFDASQVRAHQSP